MREKIMWAVFGVVTVGFLGWAFFEKDQFRELQQQEESQQEKIIQKYISENTDVVVEAEKKYPIISRKHINVGDEHKGYTTNPPLSGAHAAADRGGFYPKGVKDENAIHNLEHGFIWISYKNISESDISKIKEMAKKNPGSVIASYRSENDFNGIVLVSWGNMMKLKYFDKIIIEDFMKRNKNKSPEKLAR